MRTHLRQAWADSGVVADLLDAAEVSEAEKREKLTPREVFDLLLYARGEPGERTESQFVRFTHLARKVLRGVSGDTRVGGPQHQLWNRAIAMYGSLRPKVMPSYIRTQC